MKQTHIKIIVILMFIQLLTSVLIFSLIQYTYVTHELNTKIRLIKSDLQVNQNLWDLTKYNRDPGIIGSYPLYLISTDGFILDRRSPIHGFLDTSNYKILLDYQKIQTIKTISNQTRRIYALPIKNKFSQIGVIAVSYFNPELDKLEDIDSRLKQTGVYIASQISIKNEIIDTKRLDERDIPLNVSYIIVDKYNTVIARSTNVNNQNRIPNYIDASYIKNFLNKQHELIQKDSMSNDIYLLKSDILVNKQNNNTGVIIVGSSISSFLKLLGLYVLIESVVCFIIFTIFYFILNKYISLKTATSKSAAPIISFIEEKGLLLVNKQEIVIPYATNQFILLKVLINKPQKRWENDELLRQFGENTDQNNWRKVYDAMNSINKKVSAYCSIKIILLENKTYRLNPKIRLVK